MKTTIKTLLYVAIVMLIYFMTMGILTPIKFEKLKGEREKDVIETLTTLRVAQLEYKDQHGRFVSTIDSLLDFIKTGEKNTVMKVGVLSDAQLEAGLTEKKAVQIIRKGNAKEIASHGLENFRRDTTKVSLLEALYDNKLKLENIDNLRYIPHTENVEFEMGVNNSYVSANGIPIPLCEIRAPFSSFLSDINKQEALNLIDLQEKLFKYPGIKVGSLTEPNNFAGNWE